MTIKTQLTVGTAALVAAVVVAIAATLILAQRHIVAEQYAERNRVLADTVTRIARESMDMRDDLMLLSHLKLLLQHRKELTQVEVKRGARTFRLGAAEPNVVALERTVRGASGRSLGLKIGFSRVRLEYEIEAALTPLVNKTLGVAAVVLVLGMVGAWILAFLLSRHIRVLAHVSARFQRGDLAARVVPAGPDEVRLVASQFNDMAAHLQQLMAFKEDLLHTLAHELNTPLGSVRGYLELWKDRKLSNEDRAAALQSMSASVAWMETSLRAALALFKAEHEPLPDLKVVGLRRLVADSVRTFAPVARQKGLELRIEAASPAAVALSDPERIRQIVFNLVSNAVKYSREGGAVTVRYGRAADDILVSVSNQGPHIPPGSRAEIFSKFKRLATPGGMDVPGTGLGLAIVKQAVSELGGKIEVDSDDSGLTTFRAVLPRITDTRRTEEGRAARLEPAAA